MPKNEDGEFELLVGNKQLLSIVVALIAVMGVVFSMGYLLGRSASTGEVSATAASPPSVSGQGRPDAAGRQSPPAAPVANNSQPPGEVQVPDAGTGTSPVTSTPPAGSGTSPAQPAAEPTAPPPQRQETRPAVVPAKPPEAPPPSPPPHSAGSPAPGETYLQVGAVKKPQAEALVEVLRTKGFKAIISPVTVDGEVYRALVGPITSAPDLARTKAELQRAGVPCIVKRF
jgi:cell division septation protein DedD